MPQPIFKEYFFERFIEWEKQQPGKRSSVSAFARWLSDNSYNVEIKQQLVSDWIKGRFKPSDEKFVLVLAEKLGNEIYDVLQSPRPDPFVVYIQTISKSLKDDQKKKIAEQKCLLRSNQNPPPLRRGIFIFILPLCRCLPKSNRSTFSTA